MKVPPSAYLPAVAGRCVGGGFALHSDNYGTTVASFGVHQLFTQIVCKKSCCVIIYSFCHSLHFPLSASQYRFFRISVLKRTARKKEKSAMIEAKASRTRERKETVFNEKKTVRDFGSSFGMSALAEESVQARFTDYDQVNQTITVMPGRIPRRNWGISMASPPFWRWMDSSSRT